MNTTNTNIVNEEIKLEIIEDEDVGAVFNFEDYGFDLIYENSEWVAVPYDDSEIIIIESEQDDITLLDDIQLFNGFVLTLEQFKKFKKALADD